MPDEFRELRPRLPGPETRYVPRESPTIPLFDRNASNRRAVDTTRRRKPTRRGK